MVPLSASTLRCLDQKLFSSDDWQGHPDLARVYKNSYPKASEVTENEMADAFFSQICPSDWKNCLCPVPDASRTPYQNFEN